MERDCGIFTRGLAPRGCPSRMTAGSVLRVRLTSEVAVGSSGGCARRLDETFISVGAWVGQVLQITGENAQHEPTE